MKKNIIVLGMHRSGTTLLVNILQQLDIFMGKDLQNDLESRYFLYWNNWMLGRNGLSWDHPCGIEQFLSHQNLVDQLTKKIQNHWNSFRSSAFWGGYKKNKNWGWKDPRALLFLPIWSQVFPDAIYIYIKRNGVDVAASLQKRCVRLSHNNIYPAFRQRTVQTKFAEIFYGLESYYNFSTRCLDLMEAFKLWEEYLYFWEKNKIFIKNKYIEIKYEDLLEKPTATISQLAEFIGVNNLISQKQIKNFINFNRKFNFLTDKKLMSFYEVVRNRESMTKNHY